MVHNPLVQNRQRKAPTNAVSKRLADSAPVLIRQSGAKSIKRYFEFFTANIRNRNTREAYHRALTDFFAWCDDRGFQLLDIEPMIVAAYIEYLGSIYSKPSVKQHLAAIRMCFDWLVVGQVIPMNPASSVRGPKYVIKRGKTPVLTASETNQLFQSIDTSCLIGLRDRALMAVMVYSFARISAVVKMRVSDYVQIGKRHSLRLHEKGGKDHEVPAHHKVVEYLDAYIAAARISDQTEMPLFRTVQGKMNQTTDRPLSRHDAYRMVRRRALKAGLKHRIGCHTFRGTGITVYLENGGTIENAQAIAAHESPRTTKLYDRTNDEVTLDEVERIRI